MKVAQVSEYRKRLAEFHRGVVENHDPLTIDLPGGEDVVVMSRTDYEKSSVPHFGPSCSRALTLSHSHTHAASVA